MAVSIKEWNAIHEELDRLTKENELLRAERLENNRLRIVVAHLQTENRALLEALQSEDLAREEQDWKI